MNKHRQHYLSANNPATRRLRQNPIKPPFNWSKLYRFAISAAVLFASLYLLSRSYLEN